MSTREAPGSLATKAWGPSAANCTPELHPPLDLEVQWPWGQNKLDYVRFWAVFPAGSSPAGAFQRQRVGRGGMATAFGEGENPVSLGQATEMLWASI